MNADLFYLLALQQACKEGIAHLHYPSCDLQCGASSQWFALLRMWVI